MMQVQAQSSASDSSASYSHSSTWFYAGIGGALVTTAVLMHSDQRTYDGLRRFRQDHKIIRQTSPVITQLGDGFFTLGLFGGFAGYGWIGEDQKALRTAKIGVESFLFTGITVQFIKHLAGRERPSVSTDAGGYWHGPYSPFQKSKKSVTLFDAFPSGHTTTVFSTATTISDIYTQPWVSYTCYSLATVTAFTRVMERTHWLSDCFIGAIIGHYGTKLVEHWNKDSNTVAILPQIDEHQYGLLLAVKL